MKLSAIISGLVLTSFLSATPTFAKCKQAMIQAYDQLRVVGESGTVSAKLERSAVVPFRRDLPNRILEFYLNEEKLGEGTTDKQGVASVDVGELPLGTHVLKVNVIKDSKYCAEITELVVTVLEENAPIMITDIDHTIADISGFRFLFTHHTKIPELPGSIEALKRLTEKFNLVYMTARDDSFINASKRWLKYKKFPVAPGFYWDFKGDGVPSDHGEYKSAVIKKLKAKFKNVLIGFGDKPHDVVAYRENGLRAYYIGQQGETLPASTVEVKTWFEIEAHLNEYEIGDWEGDPTINQ